MKDLTLEQLNWIGSNLAIFGNGYSANDQQRRLVYDMYNHINGTKKKPNGCGRCWRNTKDNVYKQYIKQTKVF